LDIGNSVRLFVGVTDNDWFAFHAAHNPDEVNFWHPKGGDGGTGSLTEGSPFLFKLKSPSNHIAGGGFFVSHTRLSLTIAWKFFAEKNGFSDFMQFRSKILSIREEPDVPTADPLIGCTVLAIPFFLPRQMWLPAPRDWHPNIVQGKGYDTEEGIGRELWQSVLDLIPRIPNYLDVAPEIRREGPLHVVEGRQGQSAFHARVFDAYSRRCAITGERTEPALEASHIKPYKQDGPNRVNNGLLLRADLHQIFDAGLITITPDYRIMVSDQIKARYRNGREYYKLRGERLANLPDDPIDRPAQANIEWHNRFVYKG
jgi:putative restriction endonuclease